MTITDITLILILGVLVFLTVKVNRLFTALMTPSPQFPEPVATAAENKSIFEELNKKDNTDMWGND